MVVGVGIVDIFIIESRSLKEKRGVLRRIIKRTQSKFNISIAEVGELDSWKRARIGFSVVGNDRSFVNSMMDTIMRYIEELGLADIVNTDMEIISFADAMG
jgi:uncharacterized protein YlxP (DUF503 family)